MKTIWKTTGNCEHDGVERGESLWAQNYQIDEDSNKLKNISIDSEYDTTNKAIHENEKLENEKLQTEGSQNGTLTQSSFESDIQTDVAVIGAGLAGVLTAYFLQEQGLSVVVLECKEAGRGITLNTTAKITSQHGLIYQKLVRYKGEERARQYGMANQDAIQKYQEIINQLNINCDFETLPNYIYSLDNESRIQKEVDAASRIGLPAHFTTDTRLPFAVKAAVQFDDQAQFHPIKFLDGVAKKIKIYEHTDVLEIKDTGLIITNHGNVKANSVVITTHYPFINRPGYYFLRLHQEREYIVTLEGCKKETSTLNGMYLDADPQGFTFRNYQNYLLLGGGKHRAGENKVTTEAAYAQLEEAARKWYPEAHIKYTWSNQDCMTPDQIPYIGRYSARFPNLYVATGFNKWGMTSSMVAAQIISDMICKKENEYHKVFNPRRLMFSGSKVFLKDVGIITVALLSEHLKIPRDKLEAIERNQAGIIKHDGEKYGVYRDEKDNYYYVTTKCPHMGCSLEWNKNELTWDCPCHGSRFDYHGKLISNPATRDAFDTCQLKKKETINSK